MKILCPICKTNKEKLVLYNNDHYSQHMFDKYSISHIYAGLIYSLIFVKPQYVFLASIIFECLENTSYVAKRYKEAGWGLYYDTFINIFGDTICVMIGYLIYTIFTNKVSLIIIMLVVEVLLSILEQTKDYTLSYIMIRSFSKIKHPRQV